MPSNLRKGLICATRSITKWIMWYWETKTNELIQKIVITIICGWVVVFGPDARKIVWERPKSNWKQWAKERSRLGKRSKKQIAYKWEHLTCRGKSHRREAQWLYCMSTWWTELKVTGKQTQQSMCSGPLHGATAQINAFNMEQHMSHTAFHAQNVPNAKCIFHGTEYIMCTKYTLRRQV